MFPIVTRQKKTAAWPVADFERDVEIRDLGWWALSEACCQIASWRQQHPALTGLSMSVNISVKQIVDPTFPARLEGLLQRYQLPAGTLRLELTESSIMSDSTSAVAILAQFKALGVSLAIDDFGTGYSSLSYLHRFPLDTLKIDRSFTDAIDATARDDNMIARTIMPLARHLGLDVVAEGVETAQQADLLKGMRCKYAQGFLFSRPVQATEIDEMLAALSSAAGQAPLWA